MEFIYRIESWLEKVSYRDMMLKILWS